MKIVIAGGTGQVGTILARAMHADGHEVVVLSRRPACCRGGPFLGTRSLLAIGDANSMVPTWSSISPAATSTVDTSAANRREIMASRVDSTRSIGDAICSLCARRASGCRRARRRSMPIASMLRTTN